MQTKTEQARSFVRNGQYQKALKILKDFRLSKATKELYRNAYESLVHPHFYYQTRGEAWMLAQIREAQHDLDRWAQ